MKRSTRSRLDQDAEPVLVDVPPVKLGRRRGGRVTDYTGADVFRVWPDGYKRAVELLGQGVTVAEIARTLQLTRNTVAGIRDREFNSATLEQQRAKTAADLRGVAALALDKAREVLTDPRATFRPRDLGALSQAATISIQTAETLSGGAAVRVEHVHAVAADDFDEMMRRAQRAQVVDTHQPGETRAQSPAAVAGDDVQALEIGAGDARASSDMLSDVAACFPNVSERFRSVSPVAPQGAQGLGAVDQAADAGADTSAGAAQVGGEGVARGCAPQSPNGNSPAEFRHMPSGEERAS